MTVRRTRLPTEKHDLGPVRLYREDLQAIASAVGELGKLEIACDSTQDSWEASETWEFRDFPVDLLEVTISAQSSSGSAAVSVTFSKINAQVELTDPDVHCQGILSRIRTVCKPRRRLFWHLHKHGAALALVAFFALVILIPIEANAADSPLGSNGFFSTFFPLLLISLIPVGLSLRWLGSSRKAIIINDLRASNPSYWRRTGDMWIIGIITTVAGAVLGYILGSVT